MQSECLLPSLLTWLEVVGWVGSAGSLHVKIIWHFTRTWIRLRTHKIKMDNTPSCMCVSLVLPLILKHLGKEIWKFCIQETLKALFRNEHVHSRTVFSNVYLCTNVEILKPHLAPTEALLLVLGSYQSLVNGYPLMSAVSITVIGWQAWCRLSTTTLRPECWNSRRHHHLDPLRTYQLICGTVAQNWKGSQNSNRLHQYLWKNSNISKYNILTSQSESGPN
jgi:hypothetical protein